MRSRTLVILVIEMLAWSASASTADEAEQAGSALITYCQACHGIGKLRFIHSKDPAVVWSYIHSTSPQGSSKLWSEEIRDALSWPEHKPPPPGSLREPGKEWMPKGTRRQDIHADRIGAMSAREFLLRHL